MHYADYKTILSAQNGFNLYRGCTHGCIYCDSRSECYQMDHDFEDIEVKRNAVSILDAQLKKKRTPCMVGTGAMSDPYIPLEEELNVTRQCLELIANYGFGLTIQSKSARILRDLDLFKEINKKTKCVVQLTVTTFNDDLSRILEPNVSTTSERLDVFDALREERIPTVAWLSPILPFINDTEENLRLILKRLFRANVRGIICFGFGVTMRDGNREYFFNQLEANFPGLKEKYIKTYGNLYNCISPYSAQLEDIFIRECRKQGVMCTPVETFSYLRKFEKKSNQQLSFYGLD
ncbi:MAG: radical SAM protein [Clostridiales bacterium]|jgi:DNA repair photolyase|nr:radical SAM protein [Clostridiales bacterium]